ncbi:MAG: Lrp/AsnC ligand binding domain-containing protein [Candidatus Bathyarchaeota archaeon]|nr:Lrp/AsnC ligand binding domain-containing protein [Candidatus Bathyarchaeota archaeon]
MGLTCRAGHYNELIEKLLAMDIPKGNISLLYGPIDIFIKLDKLKNLNEFVKKWSTPIRMIGGDKKCLSKTMTYIVAVEGPAYSRPPSAFMFLNVEPQEAERVQKELLKFPQVISADVVFGPCDLIVPLSAKDQAELTRAVESIHEKVSGIEEAHTTVVAMMHV